MRLGAQAERTKSPEVLAAASAVVLPGVGHYSALIRALDKNGLRESLVALIRRGVPFLGICLGLQALYETSEEAPELSGLKLLPGCVRAACGGEQAAAHGMESGAARERRLGTIGGDR